MSCRPSSQLGQDTLFEPVQHGGIDSLWSPDSPGQAPQCLQLRLVTTAVMAHHEVQVKLHLFEKTEVLILAAGDEV